MIIPRICQVFKSLKKEGVFLYVDKKAGMSAVPDVLLDLFGAHKAVVALLVKPEMQIAGVRANKVLQEIETKGFYLQMPPPIDDEMRILAAKNSRLQC